jgi:hypothetical protein
MFGFVRHCTLLALSFVLVGFSEPHPSEARDGCIPGTYLVKEGSGTQSLWTLSVDGTLHITSSAEVIVRASEDGAMRAPMDIAAEILGYLAF